MFWDTVNDNTIDITVGRYYSEFKNMRVTTPEGYRCDPLTSSHTLFLGSCDMSGPLNDPEAVWSRIIYKELSKSQQFPYIALSRVNTGVDAMLRRLNGYCDKYGPPKKLYIVLPRTTGVELPIRGCLLSVGANSLFSDYLLKINRITPNEHTKCMAAIEFYRSQIDSAEFHLYKFEQYAMVLRLLCERYGIEMCWTPNLSVTAIDYYHKWMELFLREVPWMASTLQGVGEFKDTAQPDDGSAGVFSQQAMASVLLDEKNSLESVLAQIKANQNCMINTQQAQYQRLMMDRN